MKFSATVSAFVFGLALAKPQGNQEGVDRPIVSGGGSSTGPSTSCPVNANKTGGKVRGWSPGEIRGNQTPLLPSKWSVTLVTGSICNRMIGGGRGEMFSQGRPGECKHLANLLALRFGGFHTNREYRAV